MLPPYVCSAVSAINTINIVDRLAFLVIIFDVLHRFVSGATGASVIFLVTLSRAFGVQVVSIETGGAITNSNGGFTAFHTSSFKFLF